MIDEPIVLAGGGGHAKVIVDIFRQNGARLAGCIAPAGSSRLDASIPVLGGDDELGSIRESGLRLLHVAIGDNRIRRRLAQRALEFGFELVSAISKHAVVSSEALIGAGTAVMPGAVINTGTCIGMCAIINTSASVDHDCDIADFVHVAPGSHLAGCVRVGEGSFLGTATVVIPGTAIGSWSVVGAGGVVIASLPDRVTAVGIPARVIKDHKEEVFR